MLVSYIELIINFLNDHPVLFWISFTAVVYTIMYAYSSIESHYGRKFRKH